jgi:hypothetical protein
MTDLLTLVSLPSHIVHLEDSPVDDISVRERERVVNYSALDPSLNSSLYRLRFPTVSLGSISRARLCHGCYIFPGSKLYILWTGRQEAWDIA